MLFYSGVKDPSWIVKSDDTEYSTITESMTLAIKSSLTYDDKRIPAILGYKGFLLQEVGTNVVRLIIGDMTKKLQTLLFASMPKSTTKATLQVMVEKGIENGKLVPYKIPVEKSSVSKRWAHPPSYSLVTYTYWENYKAVTTTATTKQPIPMRNREKEAIIRTQDQ